MTSAKRANAAQLIDLEKSTRHGEAPGVVCPRCGTDVMVTGWTEIAQKTVSYMRFNVRGAVQIASSVSAADKARCMCCDAELGFSPVELMRIA